MKYYTAIIVEDEKLAHDAMQFLLEGYCPQIEIIGCAYDVSPAIKLITELDPDIVFLDIKMPNGSGFDVLQCLPQSKTRIIFTTAFDTYAIDALRASASDYLLKPIQMDELLKAIKKVCSEIDNQNSKQNAKMDLAPRIGIPSKEGCQFYKLSELLYVQADSSYTRFYFNDLKPVLASGSMKKFADDLDDRVFVRIHSGYIINLNFVKKYLRGDGGNVVMDNGSLLPVSRTYKSELLQKIKEAVH